MLRTTRRVAAVLALSGLAACVMPKPPPPPRVVMLPPTAASPAAALPPAALPSGVAQKQRAPVSAEDRRFVDLALAAGRREVILAQIAESKATRPELHAFARMLVSDHAVIDHRLTILAHDQGIAPAAPAVDADALRDRLAGPGAAVDRLFLDGQQRRQQALIAIYRDETRDGTNPRLKSFADEILPILHRHLRRAEALAKKPGP